MQNTLRHLHHAPRCAICIYCLWYSIHLFINMGVYKCMLYGMCPIWWDPKNEFERSGAWLRWSRVIVGCTHTLACTVASHAQRVFGSVGPCSPWPLVFGLPHWWPGAAHSAIVSYSRFHFQALNTSQTNRTVLALICTYTCTHTRTHTQLHICILQLHPCMQGTTHTHGPGALFTLWMGVDLIEEEMDWLLEVVKILSG